ncbi:MAG: hypothetical protein ACM3UZ_12285 [Acidobacteriota bacterium]
MRLRITVLGNDQFMPCVEKKVWGSKTNRFKSWQEGDYLLFIIRDAGVALARVSGPTFISEDLIWDKGIYPFRVPIEFEILPDLNNGKKQEKIVREKLTQAYGNYYSWVLFTQSLILENASNDILAAVGHKKRI